MLLKRKEKKKRKVLMVFYSIVIIISIAMLYIISPFVSRLLVIMMFSIITSSNIINMNLSPGNIDYLTVITVCYKLAFVAFGYCLPGCFLVYLVVYITEIFKICLVVIF